MWCNKCHYGSDKAIFDENTKCPICGSIEFDDNTPFSKKNLKSIRANNKKVIPPELKDASALTEEVEDHLKASKHRT